MDELLNGRLDSVVTVDLSLFYHLYSSPYGAYLRNVVSSRSVPDSPDQSICSLTIKGSSVWIIATSER